MSGDAERRQIYGEKFSETNKPSRERIPSAVLTLSTLLRCSDCLLSRPAGPRSET
ncbi:hypothetical protein IQ07DRAFT_583543 [Pyrenochaeta sp. DS3sAY3a]|nr:hypothetical protein IQ07DRAFT_583543 [Pyrenochaeta sp. DS3sAY3a]